MAVVRPVKEKCEREEVPVVKNTRSANRRNKRSMPAQVSNMDQSVKRRKVEPSNKEEGEISDTEEPQYKERVNQEVREERWHDWCETNMQDQLQTLTRLEKLQRTSSDLPKDEVRSLGSKMSFSTKKMCLFPTNGKYTRQFLFGAGSKACEKLSEAPWQED